MSFDIKNDMYTYDYNQLKHMTYNERIEEFNDLTKDRDMAVLLEYFYTSYWDRYGFEFPDFDYMYNLFVSEIVNYYEYLVYSQSGNKTTSKVYAYTNENLENFYNSPEIDVRGKRVLTVGSSGDQAFNAIYHGAKAVDIVDMNIMTKLFVDLKTAMIKNLTFDEFSKFSEGYVDNFEDYYPKISHDLPKNTQLFFDQIMIDGVSPWLKNFIRETGIRSGKNSVFYKDEEAYYDLQDKLLDGDYDLNIIVGDLRKFVNVTEGKYDLILLSNIFDYFSMHASTDMNGKGPEEFYLAVKNLYDYRLNDNGVIEVTSRDRRYDNEYMDYMNGLLDFLETLKGEVFDIKNAGMNLMINADFPALMIRKTPQDVSESE